MIDFRTRFQEKMHKLSFGGGIVKVNQLRSKDCSQAAASMDSFSTGKKYRLSVKAQREQGTLPPNLSFSTLSTALLIIWILVLRLFCN